MSERDWTPTARHTEVMERAKARLDTRPVPLLSNWDNQGRRSMPCCTAVDSSERRAGGQADSGVPVPAPAAGPPLAGDGSVVGSVPVDHCRRCDDEALEPMDDGVWTWDLVATGLTAGSGESVTCNATQEYH